MELQDSELINNLSEKSDEARDVLYDKYKYIVDIIMNKYKRSAYYLSVDMQELRQEALLGFSDALYSYNDDKGCNLPTFISLCVERRVSNYLRKYNIDSDEELCKNTHSLIRIGCGGSWIRLFSNKFCYLRRQRCVYALAGIAWKGNRRNDR